MLMSKQKVTIKLIFINPIAFTLYAFIIYLFGFLSLFGYHNKNTLWSTMQRKMMIYQYLRHGPNRISIYYPVSRSHSSYATSLFIYFTSVLALFRA